jgi:transposase
MPKSYSEDLRWRAVWLALVRGRSCEEIARVLFMCERSVYRYLALFHATGSVHSAMYTSGPKKVLNDFEQLTVLQSLICRPTSYLREVQNDLLRITGVWVSPSTICRTIKQQGFTRKKVQSIALQRSEQKRIEFMAQISQYTPDMLIWIDETGSDRRRSVRSYGYALRGMPPRHVQLRVGGRRISAVPVLTTRGIEDVYVTRDTVNGEKFVDFICQCVLPIIKPYDGQNPNSVVILDNASIHHVERVREIITGVGARLCFLPPYSPDLMPLEEAFSKVKYSLKEVDNAYISTTCPETIVKLAFCSITRNDCLGYIRHAGY